MSSALDKKEPANMEKVDYRIFISNRTIFNPKCETLRKFDRAGNRLVSTQVFTFIDLFQMFSVNLVFPLSLTGGAVASWLVRLSPDRAVRVRALAGVIALCSWARQFTLTVPLSTQEYKWIPANCWGKHNKLLGSDLRWSSIPSRGSRNTPSRFMLRKPG